MSIKSDWIVEFEKLLIDNNPLINSTNILYSYQIASAYFDYASDGQPEETPSEAFLRWAKAKSGNSYKDNHLLKLAEEAGGARLADNVIQMTAEDLERFLYFVKEDY